MSTPTRSVARSSLPVTSPLTTPSALSIAVAVLMGGLSLAGLMAPGAVYRTDDARSAFLTNDVINLFVGLPILVASMWLSRRGSLVGLLLWPGALLYAVYNYTAYVFGVQPAPIAWVYLAVVAMAAYAIVVVLGSIDGQSVTGRLSGLVPVRLAGWVLVVLGGLYILRAASTFAVAAADGDPLPATDVGVLIADVVLSAAMIASGGLLLRHKPLGYVSGLGTLFGASMLFFSLIVFLLLQPLLTAARFVPLDVVVVLAMGMVCFVPFALYLRGVASVRV